MKRVEPTKTLRVARGDCDYRQFAAGLPNVDSENLRVIWKEIADFNIFKLLQPYTAGGDEALASSLVQKMVAFGEGCRDNGLALAVNSHIWTIQKLISEFGTAQQQADYLPQMMSGDWIGAFALTEAEAGSDALNVRTRAEPADDGYMLNGRKCFVGMGPICDVAIVFASSAPDKGRWGLSVFLVHADDVGFDRGQRTDKLGLNAIPMGELSFDNCWIPASRRIGPEGSGAAIIQMALDWERSFILASQVGAMSRQLAECVEFAANRQVFGQQIAEFQSVSNRLADMRVRLETSKLMLQRAAELYDRGQPLTQFAAMTNLHVSEAFLNSSMDAMRIYGGAGYLQGHTANADLSDATGGILYSGTSDIQRQIIAKMEIAKHPRSPKSGGASNDR